MRSPSAAAPRNTVSSGRAFAQLSPCRACGRAIHRAFEGPQSHHALRRTAPLAAPRARSRQAQCAHGSAAIRSASATPPPRPTTIHRWAIGRMLKDGEGDLLVWIASISPSLVRLRPGFRPSCSARRVSRSPRRPPSSSPSVRRARSFARLIRVDNVVSLPLKDLGRAPLPSSAEILAAIQAAL